MTASNTEEVVYARATKRIIAFMLDYLVIVGYIIVLTLIAIGLMYAVDSSQAVVMFTNPFVADLLTFLTLVLPVILYHALLESSVHQATWGKQKIGIKVIDVKGSRLSRPQALLRSLVKFLPWQMAHTCIYHVKGWPSAPEMTSEIVVGLVVVWVLVGVYVSSLILSKTHRTPYDWLASACVIVAR